MVSNVCDACNTATGVGDDVGFNNEYSVEDVHVSKTDRRCVKVHPRGLLMDHLLTCMAYIGII